MLDHDQAQSELERRSYFAVETSVVEQMHRELNLLYLSDIDIDMEY